MQSFSESIPAISCCTPILQKGIEHDESLEYFEQTKKFSFAPLRQPLLRNKLPEEISIYKVVPIDFFYPDMKEKLDKNIYMPHMSTILAKRSSYAPSFLFMLKNKQTIYLSLLFRRKMVVADGFRCYEDLYPTLTGIIEPLDQANYKRANNPRFFIIVWKLLLHHGCLKLTS